ncbi:MAG: shikimate kinase [Christensenellales bacterium]|jgi:shikimate kinase
MNISYTGFMASGKSTLARAKATELKVKFVSSDAEIEKALKLTINEIFAIYGEEYFRKAETDTLRKIYKGDNLIVDLGGGAPVYNYELIKSSSRVIFVDTDFEIIWNRLVEDTTRPLVKDKSKDDLYRLYLERLPIYRKIADEIIIFR